MKAGWFFFHNCDRIRTFSVVGCRWIAYACEIYSTPKADDGTFNLNESHYYRFKLIIVRVGYGKRAGAALVGTDYIRYQL